MTQRRVGSCWNTRGGGEGLGKRKWEGHVAPREIEVDLWQVAANDVYTTTTGRRARGRMENEAGNTDGPRARPADSTLPRKLASGCLVSFELWLLKFSFVSALLVSLLESFWYYKKRERKKEEEKRSGYICNPLRL